MPAVRVEGRGVLVTGAARRVGRAIALALARRKARLLIHYRRSAREARKLRREVLALGAPEPALLQADLSDAGKVLGLARRAMREAGPVDVLVNNASLYERATFGRITPADWDRHLDVNLRAPFLLSQALGLAMKRAGRGKIVNVADWAAHRPYPGFTPYCVSKAGLVCLNTALARALAPQVQVNAVLPGPVLLPEGTPGSLRRAIREATLVKRLGSPEDVAAAVLFLVEGSDFITGAALAVDGGRLVA